MPCRTSSTSAPAATPSWASTSASEQPWAPMPGKPPLVHCPPSPPWPCLAGPVLPLFKTRPVEQQPPLEPLSQTSACCRPHSCPWAERLPASCKGAKGPRGSCRHPSMPGLCRESLWHYLRGPKEGRFQYLPQAVQGSSWPSPFPSWHLPSSRATDVGVRSACCDARAACSLDPRVPSLGSMDPSASALCPSPTGKEKPCGCLGRRSRCCWQGHHDRDSASHLGIQGSFLPPGKKRFLSCGLWGTEQLEREANLWSTLKILALQVQLYSDLLPNLVLTS